MIEPIIALYEQVRQEAEKKLKAGYRVTKIVAYTLDMEYYPPQEAYGNLNPPVFPLGRVDMSFKVTAVRLPVKYNPDEVELTIDLIGKELFVRKMVFTQQLASGWFVVEQEG